MWRKNDYSHRWRLETALLLFGQESHVGYDQATDVEFEPRLLHHRRNPRGIQKKKQKPRRKGSNQQYKTRRF